MRRSGWRLVLFAVAGLFHLWRFSPESASTLVLLAVGGVVLWCVMSGDSVRALTATAESRSRGIVARDVLSRLRSVDPAFAEPDFLARAEIALRAVVEARRTHDLSRVRVFCSDGMYECLAARAAEERSLGWRTEIGDLQIRSMEFHAYDRDGAVDALTVRVTGSAREYRVSARDEAYVSGVRDVVPFSEFWTFVRRTETKSNPARPGLLDGACPACDTAIERPDDALCWSCGAALREGADWLLVKIVRGGAHAMHLIDVANSARAFAATDSAFSRAAVEDGAVFLFQRYMTVVRTGDVAALAGHAASGIAANAAAWAARESGRPGVRRWPGECRLIHVSLHRLGRRDGHDFAILRIRWDATWHEGPRGGAPRRTGAVPLQTSMLAMMRETPREPGRSLGFESSRCPACGHAAATGVSCIGCGKLLGPGGRWVLAEWCPSFDRGSMEWLARLGSSTEPGGTPAPAEPTARVEIFAWLAEVARADGEFTGDERTALLGVARKAGLDTEQAERLFAVDAARPSDGAPPPGPEPREAGAWLRCAADIAASDGEVDPSEIDALHRLGRAAGVAPADVRLAVRRAEAEVFKRSLRTLSPLRRR